MKESTKKFLWERLTSRKLHITIVGFVISTVFLYYGILPPAEWTSFVKYIFAIYVAGSSIDKFANQGLKFGQPKTPTNSRIQQIEDESEQ